MSKINNVNVENKEAEKSGELTESHFDEEGHNDSMKKIEERKAIQKKANLEEAGKLTEVLLKDEKMPINDFIEKEIKDGKTGIGIVLSLIKSGYSRNDILCSSLDEEIKKLMKTYEKKIEDTLHYQSFRLDSKINLEEEAITILIQAAIQDKPPYEIINNMPLKRAINMEDIKYGEKKLHEKSPDNHYSIDLSCQVLPDFDWSGSKEVFKYLSFDDKTFSQTSKEHLPKGFDPKEIFEKCKSIGLGIDDVHKMGYTGKGVSVAICDWQLKPHDDIKTKEYTVEKNAANIPNYMHASAVSSILVGKQTGIAKDADLYFFAERKNQGEKDGGNDLKSAFINILKKNKELPDDKKIRVISISGPLYGEGIEKVVKELEDSGVWVLHSGEFWKDFGYLDKKDPMGDPNDLENYQHSNGSRHALFVNSGGRVVAAPQNPTAYRYDMDASASWAIPVVAGYYALACQADPSMTPEKFKFLAKDTSKIIKTKIERGGNIFTKLGGKVKIKVIDIKALIQKIEEEKNK